MKDLKKELYFSETDSTSLAEIKKLAIELLNETWTIDVNSFTRREFNLLDLGWCFEFNSRKNAIGLCSHRRKTIYVSTWFLEQHLDKALRFENTIRHEIAHAIDSEIKGYSNHGDMWKNIASQVLAIPERCVPIVGEPINKKASKYTLFCDNCGKESASHKILKRKTACGVCCDTHNFGKYTERFVLRQVRNY